MKWRREKVIPIYFFFKREIRWTVLQPPLDEKNQEIG